MLKNLVIKNYALIRHLNINPSNGFNTITGETGAGKSIMIGAVGLLLGNRADTKVLYDKNKKCIIEGLFTIKEYDLESFFIDNELDFSEETIIRREITPSGKSRAFINDTPVTLDIMRGLGDHLMDIHSQSDNLKLGSGVFQLSIIDTYLKNEEYLNKYHEIFHEYRKSREELSKIEEEAEILKKEADYHHFLFEELKTARLVEGEQDTLESELQVLEHGEEIKSQLFEALNQLSLSDTSTIDSLSSINRILQKTGEYSLRYKELSDRLESSFLEIKDIVRELQTATEEIEHDPEKINGYRNRLDFIYQLEQKHHVNSIDELLEIQKDLEEKVARNLNLDTEISDMRNKVKNLYEQVIDSADKISKQRQSVFPEICDHLTRLLKDLGMPDARIEIENSITEPAENGIDHIRILFSANKGIAPQDLKLIASGGEFSRLMFCLKYILAAKSALPTLVLDEIDSGVSGEIALKMAQMMLQMSKNHQLVVITHLPQIAAWGEEHYYVFKDSSEDKTVSLIRNLDSDERTTEIAKMIGGDNPSEAAFENARELLGKRY